MRKSARIRGWRILPEIFWMKIKVIALTENDKEMDYRARKAVEMAIEKARICKKPIARYDAETKRAYLEYPNGEREYVR